MSALVIPRIPVELYLELDSAAECRSEYLDGIMYSMAGASLAHTFLTTALGAELRAALRGGGCRVGTSDFRVMVSEAGPYFYPDCAVYCGGNAFPILVLEVLSKSTRFFDRGEKFLQYQKLTSLREYALVSQWERRIEIFRRDDAGIWAPSVYTDVCVLESVGCEVPLADIYENIELSAAEDSLNL